MAPAIKSKIYQRHPLLVKYLGCQLAVVAAALLLGVVVIRVAVPYRKRLLVVGEMTRACQAIHDLEEKRKLTAAEALRAFLSINRHFFVQETFLLPASDAALTPGIGAQPLCTPFFFPLRHSRLELRLDERTVLVTDVLPPTIDQLEMVAAREWPHSYEVQHHHPVIFGFTPEQVSTILLAVFLLIAFLSSAWVGVHLFRRASGEAAAVIDRLRDGDLSARFPSGYEAVGDHFNVMADEIQKLVRQLRESESVRVHLLQELTHDLKTPVAGLRGLLESLRDKQGQMSEAERSDFLDTGIHETIYFSRLVEDLLFISGVHHPSFHAGTRKLDLAALLHSETAVFMHDEAIRVSVSAPATAALYGEEILLQRLIHNGLDNALAFAKSRVLVELTENASHYVLRIIDDGPGPSPLERERFGAKRGTRTLREGKDGRLSLGLGSVILRKIAQAYGGDATLEKDRGDLGGGLLTILLARP